MQHAKRERIWVDFQPQFTCFFRISSSGVNQVEMSFQVVIKYNTLASGTQIGIKFLPVASRLLGLFSQFCFDCHRVRTLSTVLSPVGPYFGCDRGVEYCVKDTWIPLSARSSVKKWMERRLRSIDWTRFDRGNPLIDRFNRMEELSKWMSNERLIENERREDS